MKWEEIRRAYPRKWVIVEAIRETRDAGMRGSLLVKLGAPKVVDLALIGHFDEPRAAMQEFCTLCSREKTRELYVVPTELQRLVLDRFPGL